MSSECRSIAVCQPGLYSRLPVMPTFRARALSFSSSASAVSRPALSRMIPALRCITAWSADCTAKGFSPCCSNGSNASRIACSTSASGTAGGEEPWHRRLLRLRIDFDAAHHVMGRGPDLHRVLRDVHLRQLFELMVHARQLLLDVVWALLRGDVEQHAAVL